jgi:hypothetical protein
VRDGDMKWAGGPDCPGLLLLWSKGHDAMNQNRSRSQARAIAIAKADESKMRKVMLIRAAVIALGALAALAALPSLWSF